jgi:DNA-3-methyladenine glycosylase
MYDMFNIVAAEIDDPQAVLIRAVEPLDAWSTDLSGPGKLAPGLQITRAENGVNLTNDRLHILDDPADRPQIVATPRIGVDYAREWKYELLRFLDPTSKALSIKTADRVLAESEYPIPES